MRYLVVLIFLTLLVSCSKKTGASDRAMAIVPERFSQCHLKDSLGESKITYLWSEYDSEHNSILCFQYGGCAIEYFYHENNYSKRDTFMVKHGQPFIDDLRESYKKFAGLEGDGFVGYLKERFPTEESWIEDMIEDLADNSF